MLSGVNVPPLGQPVQLRVLVTLLKLRLGLTLQGWLLNGVPLMSLLKQGLLRPCRITPMSGLMVALSWIGLLVSLLQVLACFAHHSEDRWSGCRWGHVDRVRPEGEVQSCRGFCSVPGPLQSVQRAEMWGVIFAFQSSSAVHLGVDNLGCGLTCWASACGHHGSIPLELVKNGDLLLLIGRMLHLRGLDTARITKVKGHADEGVVLDGRVREIDRLGNNAADEAADFGRRRVDNAVIDARRNLSGVCGRWYPVILDLYRFFMAISRAVVHHDDRDGTAPDPLVWSAGTLPREVLWFTRLSILARAT